MGKLDLIGGIGNHASYCLFFPFGTPSFSLYVKKIIRTKERNGNYNLNIFEENIVSNSV
jgi:hypothetical protein